MTQTTDRTLLHLKNEMIEGKRLSREEALELLDKSCTEGLLWLANELR